MDILIGSQKQISPNLGNWTTYEFDMPEEAINVFMEPHSDARFQIVLNSAVSLWIDNLRFSGEMVVNEINLFTPHCPYERGCQNANPIRLPINENVRVIPEGDLWIEVVNIPTNWQPANLFIGLSAEDGAKLTGHIEFEENSFTLLDWYEELSLNYDSGKRYLFKLSNLGGRPYRINAWVSGPIIDLAEKTSTKKIFDWDFIF